MNIIFYRDHVSKMPFEADIEAMAIWREQLQVNNYLEYIQKYLLELDVFETPTGGKRVAMCGNRTLWQDFGMSEIRRPLKILDCLKVQYDQVMA